MNRTKKKKLPQETWNDYAHPSRIKRSYKRAIKQYPPYQTPGVEHQVFV